MKPTAIPKVFVRLDDINFAFLSIEDARARYNQLGEALGVFSPTPVVPIQEKTGPQFSIHDIRPPVPDDWAGIEEFKPEPEEDVNVWRGIRAITDPVQETPEPCACQGDVSATSADGLQDWEQKLLDLWHKYTDQGMEPRTICNRIKIATTGGKHPELKKANTAWIRDQLKRLGVDVPDPLPPAEIARRAREVQTARLKTKAVEPVPVPEPKPEPEPQPAAEAAGPVLEPTPIPGHAPEVTMQLIHVLAAGERLRMDDWRVISVLLGDMGRDSGKLTLPEVTAFDETFGPWLDHYSSLPPFKRKDIDQSLLAEWKRRAA